MTKDEPVTTNSETHIAQISLTDCLACSGCITTAETILIAQQSDEELLNQLRSSQLAKEVIPLYA